MNPLRKPFRYSYWNVSFALIAVNLLVFLVEWRVPYARDYLSLNVWNVLNAGAWWQFVTYMFTHADPTHLLFNMLGLFFFGPETERRMGSKEFLLFYFTTGILAGVLSFLIYYLTGSNVYLLGASGALFAVQLAYATFYPDSLIYIWGILPLRARTMVLGYTALTVFSMVTGLQGGVAHLTHLGGILFAWIYFLVRFNTNPYHALVGRR